MFKLPADRPALMGILNVTPDSFSDGGLHLTLDDAVSAALRMIEDGADLIDIGGESTRPGAEPVAVETEIERTIPVVAELAKRGVHVSIDTMKPEVARAALGSGAFLINDVSGFRNPEMVSVALEASCSVCIMHMQGEPRSMQASPTYHDVVTEVRDYLLETAHAFADMGMNSSSVWIDPGIGFGKTVEQNLALLRDLSTFVETGFPVMIGVSRKGFIGKVLGSEGSPLPVPERLEGTLAVQVLAQSQGARIIRAHDVKPARRTIEMATAILAGREQGKRE